MRCKALSRKNRPCPLQAKHNKGLCHIHDPEGKFRINQKNMGYKNHTVMQECKHSWHNRKIGIQCTKCSLIRQDRVS
jgi:hypothetical protein